MRSSDEEAVATAAMLAGTVLWPHAADVDRRGRFPAESIAALRTAGFLRWCLPVQYGGQEGTVATFQRLASTLGAGCPSSALIWVMHCQQVAVLSRYGAPVSMLHEVAQGVLVASVTSEVGKGGELLRAETPLLREEGRLRLKRVAPVVSYGEEAGLYLVTARASEHASSTDVVMVAARRQDGQVSTTADWAAMGMRGTRSVSLTFDLALAPAQVLSTPVRTIALQTMIPWGHVGWAAVWLGAARGALLRFIKHVRQPGRTARATSDRFLDRLARVRLSIDLGETLVTDCAREIDRLVSQRCDLGAYEDVTFQIRLNGAKAAAASLAFEAIDGLLELAGLHDGYVEAPCGIERVFRDLRSASLMFSNDRLMEINGKLQLLEGTGLLRSSPQENSNTAGRTERAE